MKISYQTALESQIACSSKGNQSKYHIEDQWIKIDYLGYEAAAERICSNILEQSNIPFFVKYNIENLEIERSSGVISKKIGCASKNFLESKTEIITLDQLCEKHKISFQSLTKGKSIKDAIQNTVNFIEKVTGINNYGIYLTSLLEFDSFVLNEDRHTNNIIFLYKDGEYIPGPFFDNGASFLSDITQDYPLDESPRKMIEYVKAKPFSSSFEKQVKACQELYGKQLSFNNLSIDSCIDEIREVYGDRIARRIELIYNLQKAKYKDYSYKENLQPILSPEQLLQRDFVKYLRNGGQAVCSLLIDSKEIELKQRLIKENIPFTILTDKQNQKVVAVVDIQKDKFMNIQKEIYSGVINEKNYTVKELVSLPEKDERE